MASFGYISNNAGFVGGASDEQGGKVRYSGTIKSINRGNGFGFITCQEIFAVYHRDVFIHKNQAEGYSVGDSVTFSIDVVEGKPQARDVVAGPQQEQQPAKRAHLSPAEVYQGKIKSMNLEKGFGFISCDDTKKIYGSDVFLHKNQLGICLKGLYVRFCVELIDNKPQARDVVLSDDRNISLVHDPLQDIALKVVDPNIHLRILSVGSGDASLSKALVQQTQRQHYLVTTFYDDESSTVSKYPEAQKNISYLRLLQQPVCFKVDATNLILDPPDSPKFDLIIFYFPHTGIPNVVEAESILSNQNLLMNFFATVGNVLSPTGFVQVALGSGHPYDKWNIIDLIECSPLKLHSLTRLKKESYIGYTHCPTIGEGPITEVADRDPLVYTMKLKDRMW
jgi:25S rRNA (uracil2634-N3)-methyltransferase